MKKKLWFFQVNYPYGKSAHIPYTAGQIAAYAFEDKDIDENYQLEKIFFLRKNVDSVMKEIDEPFIVAFSTYIWNCNYNKTLAKMIKEKYPDCTVVFGGHHVSPGGEMLEECPYIDYLLHGEGEVIFKRLMRALIGLDTVSDIPGISFRSENGIVTNPEMISSECDFPSPYLKGYFDGILKEYPDTDFMALIETSRGCPNSCAYCDWSNMKSRIRKFPLERIYGEIDWVTKNKVYGLGSADSNFGMFERDEDITDRIIESKKKCGFPVGFQTSYAKNSGDIVFNIGLKLEKSGMNKG
ncbi:MAG: cobalamin-dependent protein, partial [Acutalibacteraceae bacterium]|nr:cobalamin-dependent protein [Acutalibacteraceae bacterium]